MKIRQIRDVALVLSKLNNERLPYGFAAAVCALRKAIADGIEFLQKEELALVDAYADGGVDDKGNFNLKEGCGEAYLQKVTELMDADMPVHWELVKVKAPDVISPAVIDGLSGLIEFEEA